MDDDRGSGVGDGVVYQQAMDTFRSTGAQVVSTAGVLATSCGVVVGFAVERNSPPLLAVAAVFPLAIELLFRRWRRLDHSVLRVAVAIEERSGRTSLAQTLMDNWQHDGRFMRLAPIGVAAALAASATIWWIL